MAEITTNFHFIGFFSILAPKAASFHFLDPFISIFDKHTQITEMFLRRFIVIDSRKIVIHLQ